MGFTLKFAKIDERLVERLRQEADLRRVPLDVVAEEWLRRGAESSKPQPLPITPEDRAKLLAMAGTWTPEEADAFDRRIEEMFGQIDEELWK